MTATGSSIEAGGGAGGMPPGLGKGSSRDWRRAFDADEYARRVALVRSMMAERGLDLVVCFDPANMCWLTGYDAWSFYVPQAVLVHQETDSPVWIGRKQDARAAEATTDLVAANIVGYPESLVMNPLEHPADFMAEEIIRRGWGDGTVGVELDAPCYTARTHQHLLAGLPNAALRPCHDLVNWARLRKSDAELALMEAAGRITDQAMSAALGLIRPGAAQNQVVAEIARIQIAGLPDAAGDYAAIVPLLQMADETVAAHLTWSDRPLPDSGLVMLEIAGVRKRYHVPMARTFHLGTPPRRIADLTRVIVEGVERALEAARPGATCEEVEAVWQNTLNRHGIQKDSRAGYSVGLSYPPDWGERTASLRAGDRTVLESGMCFHFQSGVWLGDYGAAVSETFHVAPGGGRRFCAMPRELLVI